ncbi:MAG TPA: L,D-transpeptidase [Mycobacteriales bacterium]|nr:L,D-transpeptidase [Mycobacteriales bacterium]
MTPRRAPAGPHAPGRTRLRATVAAVAALALTASGCGRTHHQAAAPAPTPAVAAVPELTTLLPSIAPPSPKPPPELPSAKVLAAAYVKAGAGSPHLSPQKVPAWATVPPDATIAVPVDPAAGLPVVTRPGGPAVKTLVSPTDKGAPLALPVFGHAGNGAWTKVLLAQRPNQSYGYVKSSLVRETPSKWRIDVNQGHHRMLLWYGHTLLANWPVAVGAPATPTPLGEFFVDVIIDTDDPYGAYGKWIVGTSGYSEVYTSFGGDGGDTDALIGIHGTDEQWSIGHSVSHGCVRTPNEDSALLAQLVPLGTPVRITA